MSTRTRVLTPIAAALALALAAPAGAQVTQVGATENPPAASCPENCQAVGKVTGFQTRQGAVENPFRFRVYGKVVAFSITLGKPNAEQSKFFSDQFGGASQARLSVLRPYKRKRGETAASARNKWVLTGQSQLVSLSRYFGSTPTFSIQRPLTVRPGYVAALTVPTWAPALGVGLGENEQWRSSRDPKRCDELAQEAAQMRLGGTRTYGCLYKTARLLYSAYVVADPKPTSTPARTTTR